MRIVEKLITSANRPGRKMTPAGICMHWTANTRAGANAMAHYSYWQNNINPDPKLRSSAHYAVDDTQAVRLIPEDEVAWHAGGAQYTDLAKQRFGSRPNDHLIGIEMCVNSDGDWAKAYRNSVLLAADICRRRGWGPNQIYRHFDMTGKDCPRMMTRFVSGGEDAWQKFKADVAAELQRAGDEQVSKHFVDTRGHWAEGDIDQFADWGLLAVPADKRFRPNDTISRAEIVVLLVRTVRFVLAEVRKMLGK